MEQNPYLAWLKKKSPSGYSYAGKHFRKIAALCMQLIEGEVDRARVHMPPRHGKTETITKRLALYLLFTEPAGTKILITGFSQRFANKISASIRDEYLRLGGKIRNDTAAKDNWETSRGLQIVARGVGTPPTGEGFKYIIIDDPIRDRKQAESEVFRDAIEDWYTDGLYTRLAPGGRIIGIWTLWHEDDLAGRLDAREKDGGDKWTVLKLPAINEKGEALWPEMWPVDALERIRAALLRKTGERGWQALYQQNPTPLEGGLFKVGKFVFVDEVPEEDRDLPEVTAWDFAASAATGDYTANVKMQGPNKAGFTYVKRAERRQVGTDERDAWVLETARMDGPNCAVTIPKDPGSAGKSQVLYMRRFLSGFNVIEVTPDRKKELRAGPYSSNVNAGLVRVIRGDWNSPYVEELRTFPGKHDDQVDVSSDAFNYLTRPSWDWSYETT